MNTNTSLGDETQEKLNGINEAVSNIDQAIEFLGNLPFKQYHIVTFPEGEKPQALNTTDLNAVRGELEHWDMMGWNCYFHTTPAPRGITKASKQDLIGQHCQVLQVDIDLPKQQYSPKEHRTALRDLFKGIQAKAAEIGVDPSFCIYSGNGFQLLYVLADPIQLDAEQIAYVEDLNKRLCHHFGGDPKCTDVSRVMRLPGTVNVPDKTKRKLGRQDQVARLARLGSGDPVAISAMRLATAQIELPQKESKKTADVHQLPVKADPNWKWSDALVTIQTKAKHTAEPGEDRSGLLFNLIRYCQERGMTKPQVAALLLSPEIEDGAIGQHIADQKQTPAKYVSRQINQCWNDDADILASGKLADEWETYAAIVDAGSAAVDAKRTIADNVAKLKAPKFSQFKKRAVFPQIIDNMVADKAMVLLVGKRGAGKSTFLSNVAVTLAAPCTDSTGKAREKTVCGDPRFPIPRQHRVLLLALEDPETYISKTDLVQKHYRITTDELDEWLTINPEPMTLERDSAGLLYVYEWLRQNETQQPIIIVDTFARSKQFEENDNTKQMEYVRNLQNIGNHFGASYLIACHPPKGSVKDQSSSALDDVRGGGAIQDAAPTRIFLKADGHDRTALTVPRNRRGEKTLDARYLRLNIGQAMVHQYAYDDRGELVVTLATEPDVYFTFDEDNQQSITEGESPEHRNRIRVLCQLMRAHAELGDKTVKADKKFREKFISELGSDSGDGPADTTIRDWLSALGNDCVQQGLCKRDAANQPWSWNITLFLERFDPDHID